MSILYIANCRMPSERAHSKQIFKTSEALSRKVTKFELWLPNRPQLKEFHNISPFSYYGSANKFTIRKFSTIDFLNYSNSLPKLVQTLIYFLEEATFLLSLAFQNPRFDIVYTRSLTVALLSKFVWRKKSFYEIHNFSNNIKVRRLFALLLNSLSGTVAISMGLKKTLANFGVSNVAVAPDGVDLSEFQRAKRQKTKTPTVVYTGGLTADKGIYTLLEAAEELRNINFLIAGGNYTLGAEKKLNETIFSKNLTNVTYLGILKPQSIPPLLTSASVLVLPSSGRYLVSKTYTSPMKLFEYMASNVPIIATSTSSNKELLEHNVNAYLVSPDSSHELAQGIKALLRNKSLSKKIATQAKKDIKKYTWNSRAEVIINYLKK